MPQKLIDEKDMGFEEFINKLINYLKQTNNEKSN